MVEEVQDESLYLHFVQVGEEGVDAVYEQTYHKLLVCVVLMRLPIYIDLVKYDIAVLNNLNELRYNLSLCLEATHVSVVSHDCEDVSDNQQVEVLEEYGGDLGVAGSQGV